MFDVPTRIALISDNEIVLHGLSSMLDDTGADVSVRGSGSVVATPPSDLTVLDASLMTEAEMSMIRHLVDDAASGTVVLFGWDFAPSMVSKALDMGCGGCFDKSLSSNQFVSAMKRIMGGDAVLSPALIPFATSVPRAMTTELWPGRTAGLTQRESEVMQSITRGLTNVEIAMKCYLSVNTVKYYVRSAYRKIGVERRSQAVKWGMENGMGPVGVPNPTTAMTPVS